MHTIRPTETVLFLFLSTLLPLAIFGQKPVDRSPLEFGAAEATLSYSDYNRKVEAGTDRPLVLHQTEYRVGTGSAEEQARAFIGLHSRELGIETQVAEQLQLHKIRENVSGTTVRFNQFFEGVRVAEGTFSLTILPNGKVVMVNNSLVPGITLSGVVPAFSADRALLKLSAHLGVDATREASVLSRELMVLRQPGGARLAHRIVAFTQAPHGEWEAFVDARTGELLRVTNQLIYNHGHEKEARYVPFPFLVVDGTGVTFDPDPLSTGNATYGDAGFTDNNDNTTPQLIAQQRTVTLLDITNGPTGWQLKGPWAEIVDFDSPSKGLFIQPTSDFSVNRDDDLFEAVTCYFHIDASMRYLNLTLGLDIRPDAYTGGVRADPSGVSGDDQSFYSGGGQRLSFGEGGVDDAEDSDVIHHELGHGLHDWVTGGNLSQVNGLSEGVGDYWAVSYNRSLGLWQPSDDAYNHVFTWDGHNQFWNGRRVDTDKTYPNNLVGQVHADGGIWAAANMLIWNAIGKEKTDRIFWNGLGMTDGSSNQNDAANAVYQAALADPNMTAQDRRDVHDIYTARGYTLPSFSLPVEWLTIDAVAVGKQVEVSWSTAVEEDNDHFTVQRSTDGGRTFADLGRVRPRPDGRYGFTDATPVNGRNVYRIQQTDLDGTTSVSELVSVDFDGAGTEVLLPNPVSTILYLRVPAGKNGGKLATLYDLAGRELRQITTNGNLTEISVAELPAGTYLLRFELEGEMRVERFVKR